MDNLDSISRPLQGPITWDSQHALPILGAEEAIQAGQAPGGVRLAPTTVPIATPPLDQPDVKTLAERYTASIEARGKAELRIDAAKASLAKATADATQAAAEAESIRLELMKMLASPCS